MKISNSILLVGLLASSPCAAKGQLLYELSRNSGAIIFKLTNASKTPVPVHSFAFTDPSGAGHWIFLYDPKTRKLLRPGLEVFPTAPTFEKSIQSLETIVLKPGGEIKITLPDDQILQYYNWQPQCYLLIAKYRQKLDGRIVESAPSNTIELCPRED